MSTGKSQSRSQSQSVSNQFVDPLQVPFLQTARTQAQQLALNQLGPIANTAQALSGDLLTSGQQFVQGLLGGAGGPAPGVAQAQGGLLNFQGPDLSAAQQLIAGGAQSANQLLGQNPALGGQLSALDAAIQNNLQSTLGSVAGQATLGGQTGGSRQALVSGLAAQEAQRQFASGASNLVSQDFAARQQLAPQLVAQQIAAGQALQQGNIAAAGQQLGALQGAGQLGIGQGGLAAQAAGTGLQGLSGLFDLGLAPFQAAFSPLLNLASIIGAPTVLSESQSSSRGRSDAFSFGLPSGG